MKKYKVTVTEIYSSIVEVEANSPSKRSREVGPIAEEGRANNAHGK